MKEDTKKCFKELLAQMIDMLNDEERCECDCSASNNTERLKSFEECTLGEKYIITLLETNKIAVDDFVIEHAEQFLFDNPAIDFLMVYSEPFRNVVNELLNSLNDVDIDKLRTIKK